MANFATALALPLPCEIVLCYQYELNSEQWLEFGMTEEQTEDL